MKAVSADELKRYWRRWKRWGFFNGRLKYTDAHDCNIIVSKFYGDFVNEYTLDNDECPAIGIMYVNGFEHWAINGFESEDKMYVFEVQTGEVVDYEVNKQVAF